VNGRTWKIWVVPGGILLGLAAVLVNSPFLVQVAPSLGFYYVAVFAAGLFLAWRFHSTRVLFSLLSLLLAHRAVEFFSDGDAASGPGRMVVLLATVFVPVNFTLFALIREWGFILAGIAPRAALLFLESVLVAVMCRPENSGTSAPMSAARGVPALLFLLFVAAVAVFVRQFLRTRRPTEPGFAWSAATAALWLGFAPIGKAADAYVATAALILAASLIETSYVLAYHDELTGIRGRRAFNDALLSLDQQYAIAIVDIDHFKKFNDTYGHDTGDQVLCMVAARLSKVTGGGQAFRCGGEEFAIIFRDLSAKDALEHLEALRRSIEQSAFKVRGAERRTASRPGTGDRRKPTRKKAGAPVASPANGELSVTVSIGVAEPSTRNRQPERVIEAADQALYRAKENGRNRVETASAALPRAVRARRDKV
jgi:diguanylate cyclase (GGDEF)-like protein